MASLQDILGGAENTFKLGPELGGVMAALKGQEASRMNQILMERERADLLQQQQVNDRYGQLTPHEVAIKRTEGGLANIMGRPENLQATVAGKIGESNENSVKGALALATKDSQIASTLAKNKESTQKSTYMNAARTLELPMAMLQSGMTDMNTIVNSLPESERGPFTQLMKGAMASGKFKSPLQAIPMMHQKFNEMVSNIQQQSEAAQAAITAQRADWEFGGKQREAGNNTRQTEQIKATKDAADLKDKRDKETFKTLEHQQVQQEIIMNDEKATPEQRKKAKERFLFLEKARIEQRVAVAKIAAEAEAEWNRRYGGGGGAPISQGEAQPRKTFNATTGQWEVVDGAL